MIKDPKQLDSHAEYKKAAVAAAKSVGAKPVRFLCFPKFPFGKETLPAMLIGDVPSAVVNVAKKKGGAFVAGRMRVNNEQMDVEVTSGKFDAKLLASTLKTLGIALPPAEGKMEAAAQPEGLKEKARGAEYKDEDKKMGWRTTDPAKKESDKFTTKYFNPQEKEASKVTFNDKGKMLDDIGNKIRDKEVGFVMDPKNAQVHQFDPAARIESDGKTQFTHHTSPLAGANVAGAGMIKTTGEGRVDTIKDQSGHYKPDATYTHQVVKELGKDKDAQGFSKNLVDRTPDAAGKPINKPAKVELMGKKGLSDEEFETVKGDVGKINALIAKKFGDKARIALPPAQANNLKYINILIGQTTSVTLTTQQFEQTQGNEDAIRTKKAAMDELASKTTKVKAQKPAAAAPAPAAAASPQRPPTAYSDAATINSGPAKSAYTSSVRTETVDADGYTVVSKTPAPAARKVEAASPQRNPAAYSDANIKSGPAKSAYTSSTRTETVDADGYTVVTKTSPKTAKPGTPPK